MTPNIRLALTAGFLATPFLVATAVANVAAASNNRHVANGHHAHRASVQYRHLGSGYMPLQGYVSRHGQYVPGAGDRLIYGPGYVFVPGHGILGEDCNMPTSTCTNEYRDIQ
jgi:hypothetical protein